MTAFDMLRERRSTVIDGEPVKVTAVPDPLLTLLERIATALEEIAERTKP